MKKNDFFTYLDQLEDKDEILKRWGELYQLEKKLIQAIIDGRKEKGLSQDELAKLTGIKQPAIARIESGAHSPQINTLINIVEALDLKLEITTKCDDFLKSIWKFDTNKSNDVIFYSKKPSAINISNKSGLYTIMEGGHLDENKSHEYSCEKHYPA